jgi:hypothetical protein
MFRTFEGCGLEDRQFDTLATMLSQRAYDRIAYKDLPYRLHLAHATSDGKRCQVCHPVNFEQPGREWAAGDGPKLLSPRNFKWHLVCFPPVISSEPVRAENPKGT